MAHPASQDRAFAASPSSPSVSPVPASIPCAIELPWPPAKLSPNGSRGGYFAHAKASKKYRADCLILLRSQRVRPLPSFWEPPIMLSMEFCAPTKTQPDLDNMLARVKHGIDALAEVLGVNDKSFEYTLRRGEPVKGGSVVVSIG